jgi:hypothetical protein
MGRSSKAGEKGQRSLTSFFASSLKTKLQSATESHEEPTHASEHPETRTALDSAGSKRAAGGDETICIDLSPPEVDEKEGNAEPRTSPFFERPSKRTKLDHDYSTSLPYTATGKQVDLSGDALGGRLVGGASIPHRVERTHARFQVHIHLPILLSCPSICYMQAPVLRPCDAEECLCL